MTHRPFVSTRRRALLAGLTAAVVAVLGLGAAPAHARPTPPVHEAPEVGDPPSSQPPDQTEGGPAEGLPGRPQAETLPETKPLADPDYRPNKPSPFGVLLDVQVPDPGVPEVVAHADLVEVQAELPGREATSLTIRWSDGDNQVFDLTQESFGSIDVPHEYERPTENRTYTVIAWVTDNEGGVGMDWQEVTIEALYDVTLRPIKFSPWGAGDYDCDPWWGQGEGDFTFAYALDWADVHLDKELDFDLGAGETKTILPDGVTVRDVTTSAYAQMWYSWAEHDVGNPFFPPEVGKGAPAATYIDLQPRPDESPHRVDFTRERDGCEVHITYELVTKPAA